MRVKISKLLIKKLMKLSIELNKRLKLIKHHQSILYNSLRTLQLKLCRHHRLKDIGRLQLNLVMSKLGKDIGDVLDKLGGLAKSILPIDGPKPTTQKKWELEHFGKKSKRDG